MTPTNELSLTPALNEPSLKKRTSIITKFLETLRDNNDTWHHGFSCKEDDNIRKLYDKYFKPSYGEKSLQAQGSARYQ